MSDSVSPKCPKCESTKFKVVPLEPLVEFNMTFVCCAKCGAIVGYHDDLLVAKLDDVIDALSNLRG
jgi:predicted nucleic-acid-binding Zn-ribbon protein